MRPAIRLRATEGDQVASLVAEKDVKSFDIEHIDMYTLAELEELYIDALWSYHTKQMSLLKDSEFDQLKQMLYRKGSRFPTLRRQEVAFVEASIAYYRGTPVVSDEEYEALKAQVEQSGKRKDVTAFLLYERGEQLMSREQFENMKEEYEKLGLAAVNLDACTGAQLEEMYVDALWAYYHDKKPLLTDEQYEKLKQELEWQASGFPALRRYEVEFVKASLAYWRNDGQGIVSDDEWRELKRQVLAGGNRQDVAAFLLYTKGQQVLDPDTFARMSKEMTRIGVKVKKADTIAREATLVVDNPDLYNDFVQASAMVFILSVIPVILCTSLAWFVAIFLDTEFVPQPSWGALLTAEFLPLLAIGAMFGFLLTGRLLTFLDLANPKILVGRCPSCNSEVRAFAGGVSPPHLLDHNCLSCGCEMQIDTLNQKIVLAGVAAEVAEAQRDAGRFDWRKAWELVKDRGITMATGVPTLR